MSQRILLALMLVVPFWGFSQSFNGGFEQLAPNGVPMGWTIADPSGASVTKDANIGKLAAKTWVYKNYQPGIWNSNINPEVGNAAEVTGYYKYIGDKAECEKASISYILGAKTAEGGIDTLAFGDAELKLNKKYDKFSIAVSATGTGVPEFVNIQFQPKGHCNIHGETNCCFLFVDDIVLGGRTSTDEVAPEEAPAETPAEELSDSVLQGVAPAEENTTEATEKLEEAIDENGNPETPTEVTEEPAVEETPAEVLPEEVPVEETVPVEEESTEPVDEEWDSEEESSDGGR